MENLCGEALAMSGKIVFVWEHRVDIQSGAGGRKGVWCLELALHGIYKLRTLKGSKAKVLAVASAQQSGQRRQEA